MSSKNLKTRDRILQACLHLLESGQYQNVRMTDIAARAGISRQALYLHFKTRAELLIQTTYYLDKKYDSEARLAASRSAQTGAERLDAYIEAWGNYIPEIYGLARALIILGKTDAEAKQAWDQRMQDMREGCEAALLMLEKENRLRAGFSKHQTADILWTLLSVENWEKFTIECGWSQSAYISNMKALAKKIFYQADNSIIT